MIDSKYAKYKDRILEIAAANENQPYTVARILGADIGVKPNNGAFYKYIRQVVLGDATPVLKNESKSTTKSNQYKKKPFVLSAWNKGGFMMDIDQYCTHYKLPRKDVQSYKLVSHTGTPFYNIVFKEIVEVKDVLDISVIETTVKKHIEPIKSTKLKPKKSKGFDRAIITDEHIGMEPNKTGHSLYGGEWNEAKVMEMKDRIVYEILFEKKYNVLVIDELGDLVDGWDGKTVRKQHTLPQNMDNTQQFDVAVSFKVNMVGELVNTYDEIILNNICEDNHAGPFGYIVNSAVKSILEQKYSNVTVTNHRKFINHYYMGKHCFVITHGKDSRNLKFGFKPVLDTKQIEKIDQYLKENDIYKNADFIEFSKGDSHQLLLDFTTSTDFDYCNYGSLAPPSEWVQTNYKNGKQHFFIQHVKYDCINKTLKPIRI